MIKRFLSVVAMVVSISALAEPNTAGESFRFSSGDRQVALVELYTSEGCSSCPPADRWLSGLKNESALWASVVPVAFHVDYWDYIGWRDRFARPEFTDRQQRYAREGGVNTVYTPGMFKDGREWRGWIWGRTAKSNDSNVGNLTIQLTDDVITASFDALDSPERNLTLHVALLGMNLDSQISAGENKGKTLQHDFVVLGHASTLIERREDNFLGQLRLPEPITEANEEALVAWVSPADRQAPIQATGGFLNR